MEPEDNLTTSTANECTCARASDAICRRSRLATRHWEISNGTEVEIVSGPGVIGMYPVMFPGCPVFEYQSCCPLSTPRGSTYMCASPATKNLPDSLSLFLGPALAMRGFFRMVCLRTNREFEVQVPEMVFELPRPLTDDDLVPPQ